MSIPPAVAEQLTQLAVGILTAVGLLLAKKVNEWLGTKAEASKLAAATERLWLFLSSVVAELMATVRPELLGMLKDGKLTPEEGAKLKAMALDRVKALMGEKGLGELVALLGIVAPQLDIWLGGLIEREVMAQKGQLLPLGVGVGGINVPTAR